MTVVQTSVVQTSVVQTSVVQTTVLQTTVVQTRVAEDLLFYAVVLVYSKLGMGTKNLDLG